MSGGSGPPKGSILAQAWLVMVLALVFGGALAAMHVTLSDRIAENKLRETLSQIPVLVPGADSGEEARIAERVVYRALQGEKQVGWVIPATGQGFADKVELLIGADAAVETLTGIYVLDQKETPGLGNKIIEAGWREQFAGKSALEPLLVTKAASATGQEIRAVTGATISSDTVCDTINATLAELRSGLVAGLKKN
jgi:electron transport complex protein RnfG